MDTQELIIVDLFCKQYEVEPTFVTELEAIGLVETITYDNNRYLHVSQLVIIEKIIRLHNDLNINKEGIDVVLELLNKVNQLQSEVKYLKNRLGLYE
ncbi:hypothetical protein FIA58_008810 [Flavobacterium jejuense]|uniref:Chaperone modulatory protein CbpM n=1 Tax=Flavobacterium jejuense TaxID=1544455 RepID=A0ABX0IPN2_9FLAO|nr:chaperone modulator CbpM [Flavobacterium jejuense]NHN25772.1 hypothetical protein [Flavobacterium jejuense]